MNKKLLFHFGEKLNFKQLLLLYLVLANSCLFAQQQVYLDFGNALNSTSGNWNNVVASSQNQSGIVINLIDDSGASSGIVFTLSDSFDFINTSGTSNPAGSLPFPASASKDSFFGQTNIAFNGNVNPTGGFTLSGLDSTKYYSFSIFGSRMGVSDNRETLYALAGSTTDSNVLNPSNNTSNTADILNIQPNASGEITFQAEPGPNNNNSNGFYYLGAVKLVISDTPVSGIVSNPILTLNYPNGNHVWEAGKVVRVKWESISIPDILIEFSSNNGLTWSNITNVSGSNQYYDMTVPDEISTQCLIRLSGSGLTEVSNEIFTIIPNEGVVYKIVVLGSSTAAGSGPSNINNAWVWRYQTYLTESDTRYEVTNLAVGGFTTYNILPTGSSIPSNVNRTINTNKNVTKAIEIEADGVIINLPSNDAASGYPIEDQLNNYGLISNALTTPNTPLCVTTPQPRNFGSNQTKINIQIGMIAETYNMFADNTIDFWTDIGNENGISSIYDSGDGVHMNDQAHQILYERVLAKNIHIQVKNMVDAALDINENEISEFSIYPNPITSEATIKLNKNLNGMVKISIYDLLGQQIELQNYQVSNGKVNWSKKEIQPGIYIMNIWLESKLYKHKLIIN